MKTFLIRFLGDQRGSIPLEYCVVLAVVVALNVEFLSSINLALFDMASNISIGVN